MQSRLGAADPLGTTRGNHNARAKGLKVQQDRVLRTQSYSIHARSVTIC